MYDKACYWCPNRDSSFCNPVCPLIPERKEDDKK